MIQNAVIKEVNSVESLQSVFDEGSKNRHVASTKMNAESSRSHLVIGIVIETTNLTTGAVLRGKVGPLLLKTVCTYYIVYGVYCV